MLVEEPGSLAERLRRLADEVEGAERSDVEIRAIAERVVELERLCVDPPSTANPLTHRQLRATALRLSEERLYLALSAARAMVYSRDLSSAQLLELRGASHVLGEVPSRPPMDDEWLESRIHPDDGLRVATERGALLARGARRWRLRYRILHANGDYVWVVDHALILSPGGSGQGARCVGVVIDATERQAYEEEVERASRRKDEFLAMLGHELRNPLAAIQSAMDLVSDRRLEAPLDSVVEVVERQSRHMRGLVDGLLDASRIARGKVDLEPRPLDLRGLLEQATRDAGARLDGAVTLTHSVDESPRVVFGDRVRLRQVLDNLLTNAARHAKSHIVVESGGDDEVVWAAVQDDGDGLDPEAIEEVFLPFFQGPQSLDRPQGGLGLGLSVARGIAELHGGELSAYSEGTGRGARFVLSLPKGAGKGSTYPGEPSRAPRPGAVSLLLVEDNPDVASMLQLGLERRGYEVRVVRTGAAAMLGLERAPPDVLLCDMGLPGELSGYDVGAFARDVAPSTRLIAMSGYGGAADRSRAEDSGYEAYLVKPLPLAELVAILASPPHASVDE